MDQTGMIETARRVADEILAPAAEVTDQAATVPLENLRALGDAGLFGIAAAREHGGSDLPPGEARRVMAEIAGGCGATFFVWVQHHSIVRALRQARERSDDVTRRADLDTLLTALASGDRIAGTAFAHLRRTGSPAIRATRTDGGWRLDGSAPWATSWGIARHFIVAAESADGEVVWSLLEVGPDRALAGLTATALALPVLGATATVVLRFEACEIRDDQVVAIEDAATWRRLDRRQATIGQPAPLGIADRAARHLRDIGREGDLDDDALAAADRLDAAIAAGWASDDEARRSLAALTRTGARTDARTDADPSTADVERAVAAASAHRTRLLELARAATGGLLASVGGRGMDLGHPAQRLAREADFYVIQAQTADGRRATLSSLLA